MLQFEDFERAAFVNKAMEAMWPFLEATLAGALRHTLQPVIQQQLPFPISGFEFEKLSFGGTPWHIRGVKHHPLFSGARLLPQSLTLPVYRSTGNVWRTTPNNGLTFDHV